MRRGESDLGISLLRDRDAPGHVLTVDRWRDAAACRAFRATFDADCRHLAATREGLAVAGRSLGEYAEA